MSTIQRLCGPRATLGWLAMVVAVVLGGCGPGVGGTGTGDTSAALALFGASPASLCNSELAALVPCQHDGTTATPVPGSAPLILADAAEGARLVVRLQDDTIEVVETCTLLDFRGQWGVIVGQEGRFYGHTDPDATLTPATLEARASGAGALLTLRDGEGRVLLGPVAVSVVATLPVPGACP